MGPRSEKVCGSSAMNFCSRLPFLVSLPSTRPAVRATCQPVVPSRAASESRATRPSGAT
ncbi:Uncharacterised protein [Mycobacteroides abscessus subsp. abscessus]|nr:Uncharacterised protein [Mycobacteroides abscessus subsp. abscessus]SKV54417.1 Uncharacterised protein [Mycobacteroides abscessus subsp. abscessus]